MVPIDYDQIARIYNDVRAEDVALVNAFLRMEQALAAGPLVMPSAGSSLVWFQRP